MNTKLILVIVLILIIFLLNRNQKNKQETFQNPINARFIRIEGGQNFTLSEIEVLDINGINILTPFNLKDISNNDYNSFTYKNKDNQNIMVRLEKGNFFNKRIYPLTHLIDGIIDGEDRKQKNNFFYGKKSIEHSIFIDLGKEYTIQKIKLHPRWNKHTIRMQVLDNTKVTLLNIISAEEITQESKQIGKYQKLEPLIF